MPFPTADLEAKWKEILSSYCKTSDTLLTKGQKRKLQNLSDSFIKSLLKTSTDKFAELQKEQDASKCCGKTSR
jgi:hypothetical protein